MSIAIGTDSCIQIGAGKQLVLVIAFHGTVHSVATSYFNRHSIQYLLETPTIEYIIMLLDLTVLVNLSYIKHE